MEAACHYYSAAMRDGAADRPPDDGDDRREKTRFHEDNLDLNRAIGVRFVAPSV